MMHEARNTSVALCVFEFVEQAIHVVTLRRPRSPFPEKWALPSGPINDLLDGNLEAAAHRLIKTILNKDIELVAQTPAIGGKNQGDGFGWRLTIPYWSIATELKSFTRTTFVKTDLCLLTVAEFMSSVNTYPDHKKIVSNAMESLKRQVGDFCYPRACMPSSFTMRDLHEFSQVILGRQLDQAAFRRKVNAQEIVTELRNTEPRTSHRPARLLKFTA